MNEIFDVILERAKKYCRDEFDVIHLEKALEMTKRLMAIEGGDERIIIPAILLHDTGWSTFSFEEEGMIRLPPSLSENLNGRGIAFSNAILLHKHEIESSLIAQNILSELKFPTDEKEKIVEIITGHDSRKQPISKEDEVVKDGDRLSRYTPELFSALCQKFNLGEEEFFKYLNFNIEKWFYSDTAKTIARKYLLRKRLKISEAEWLTGIMGRFFNLFLRLEGEAIKITKKHGEKIMISLTREIVYNLKKAIEIYLSSLPSATLKGLQEDKRFCSLVSQKIGEFGYIGIIDRESGRIIFHPDKGLINLPRKELKEKKRPAQYLYGFWNVYNRALNGEEFYAPYQGLNDKGEIVDKIWYVVPMDSGELKWAIVGAAVYDDFHKPIDLLSQDIIYSLGEVSNQLYSLLNLVDEQNKKLERLNEGLKQEIIERQQAEEKLIAAEKLAAASQIAAESAHEIKNPLTVIKGGVYYLSQILAKDEIIKKTLGQIDKAVDRATSYINSLLSFSRPPILKVSSVDINNLLQETLKDLENEMKAEVKIKENLTKSLPPLKADPEQLKAVFFNLIKNAIESMGEREEKRLEINTQEVTHKEGRFVLIRIKDNGVGIRSKEVEKIFNPFYTTKGKGTGLGLAICQRIIEAHQGKIGVESKEGKGATFTIKLPQKTDMSTTESGDKQG
ncbi:MAG: ATP-binding protein [bacterium]